MNNILESPDWIRVNNPETNKTEELCDWYTGYAFGYYDNKLYISIKGDTHNELFASITNERIKNVRHARDNFKYPGRLWYEEKLISFWFYPESSTEMKKIADDLDKTFYSMYNKKIDVWNDFKMDIIVDKNNKHKIYDRFNDFSGGIKLNQKIEIIPVKLYKSSLGHSKKELEIPHVMSPLDKFKKGIKIHAPGFGAEKRYSLPSRYADKVGKGYNLKDIPPFIYHQLQQTSDGIIKLKSLVENTIAKISKNINVKIDIDKTYHAGERQYRHINPISDSEIIEIVSKALPEIADKLIFDEINMGSYILIKQLLTNINIVGVLHPGNNDEIDFVVVTVMRKENFMPKKGTKVIEV